MTAWHKLTKTYGSMQKRRKRWNLPEKNGKIKPWREKKNDLNAVTEK